MRKRWKDVFVILFFALITGFIFRNYFIKHQVPFPSNLLISYYEPWTSYPLPGLPNGLPNKPMGFDNLRIYYPLKTLAIDLVKHFQPPLWNPYAFSGNTLLGTYQSAIFHPFSWLFLLIPQIDAWSVIIILQPLFASLFMYLYLRSIRLRRLPSVLGALTFSLSGFAIVWWEESYMSGYSAMALPLILYGIEKIIQNQNRNSFLILVIGICWTILSGWFQMSFYIGLFVIAYLIYRWRIYTIDSEISIQTHKATNSGLYSGKAGGGQSFRSQLSLRSFTFILSAGIVALFISGVHLLPSFEAFHYSARANTDAKYLFDGYLLPLENLVTLIAPDFYGNPAVYNYFGRGFYYERMGYFGIVPLILLLVACSVIKVNDKRAFWGYGFLIFLSLGFSLPTSWFLLYSLKLPLLSVIIPARILFLSIFCGSVLAAFGLQYYLEQIRLRNILRVALVVGVIYIAIWHFISHQTQTVDYIKIVSIQSRNMILPTGMAIITLLLLTTGIIIKRLHIVGALGLIGLTVFGSAYFAGKYLYFSERNVVFPQTPILANLQKLAGYERFWSFGSGYISNNIATQYQLFSPEGYDSFYIRRYGELIFASRHGGTLTQNIDRSDAIIKSESSVDRILDDPYRRRLLSLLGVQYIVGHIQPPEGVKNQQVLPDVLTREWSDAAYVIYRYKEALPRVFLTSQYRVEQNDQKILKTLFAPDFNPRSTVLLEATPLDFTTSPNATGTASIIKYDPQKIEISTITHGTMLLFLSDNFYPGWRAYVDGKETPVYRADYSFRAAVVPDGKHHVEFRYQPDSWKFGQLATIFGMLVIVFVFFYSET